MPDLYVIAGPNGAGKSTLSSGVLPEGLASFDGDKEIQLLQQKFPETNDAQLFSYVNDELFSQRKEEAIKASQDFAFETNFTTSKVMDSVKQFQEQGYTVNLIYIGLPGIEEAISRVALRVERGGHDVSKDQISSNYKDGIEQTKKFLADFDNVLLLENAIKTKAKLAIKIATFRKGKLIDAVRKPPGWAERIIPYKKNLLLKNKRSRPKGKGI